MSHIIEVEGESQEQFLDFRAKHKSTLSPLTELDFVTKLLLFFALLFLIGTIVTIIVVYSIQ